MTNQICSTGKATNQIHSKENTLGPFQIAGNRSTHTKQATPLPKVITLSKLFLVAAVVMQLLLNIAANQLSAITQMCQSPQKLQLQCGRLLVQDTPPEMSVLV